MTSIFLDQQHLDLRLPLFCTYALRDRGVMLTMSIMFIFDKGTTSDFLDQQHLNLRSPQFCTYVLRGHVVMLTMSIMFIIDKRKS